MSDEHRCDAMRLLDEVMCFVKEMEWSHDGDCLTCGAEGVGDLDGKAWHEDGCAIHDWLRRFGSLKGPTWSGTDEDYQGIMRSIFDLPEFDGDTAVSDER